MVEQQPSKLNTWVRFPSPAPFPQHLPYLAQSVTALQKADALALLQTADADFAGDLQANERRKLPKVPKALCRGLADWQILRT
jgi:hypothetical protein